MYSTIPEPLVVQTRTNSRNRYLPLGSRLSLRSFPSSSRVGCMTIRGPTSLIQKYSLSPYRELRSFSAARCCASSRVSFPLLASVSYSLKTVKATSTTFFTPSFFASSSRWWIRGAK